MLVLAFALTIHASIFHFAAKPASPTVTCGISTVSYRFEGDPGTRFAYSGKTYVVPASGWVELLAKRGSVALASDGHQLPIDVWPQDEFGTRHVPLPRLTQGGAEK